MTNLVRSFGSLVPMFVAVAVLLAVVLTAVYLVAGRRRGWSSRSFLWSWGVSSWVAGVVIVTVVPHTVGLAPSRHVELVPFAFLGEIGSSVGASVLTEVLANLVMFMIGGAILALSSMTTSRIVLAATLFAVFVEVMQFVLGFGRVSSVDDVIWAAAGAWIGAWVGQSVVGQSVRRRAAARHGRSDVVAPRSGGAPM
ncbi:VanZ family protein [Nesterenkonia suensis]